MRTGVENLLRRFGFDDIVHFGPAEAIHAYFADRADIRLHGAERLIVAKVAMPTAP